MRITISALILFLIPAAQTAELSRLERADQDFKLRESPERALAALEGYRLAFKDAPKDPEAGWRVAMGCYFVGLRVEKDPKKKTELFAEGRDAGKKALALKEDCAACHFWTAIDMALYGESIGAVPMFFSLSEIRTHLQSSIRLDPGYAYGGAERLLGTIDEKLPGFLGGSNKQAKVHYERAIASAPDEPMNYLFLARLLKEELDRPEEALQVAKKGLELPVPARDRLEAHEALRDLRALIRDLEPSQPAAETRTAQISNN